MKKIFFLLALIFFSANFAQSAPAYPRPITITQADGTTLTIRRYGDEFFHYTLTRDGYQVVQLEDGFYYYYTPDIYSPQTRAMTPTQRASDPSQRSQQEKNYLNGMTSGVNSEYLRLGKQVASVKREMVAQMNAHSRQTLTRSTAPNRVIGEYSYIPRTVVILAQFQDVKFQSSHNQATFTRMLMQEGYNYNGSVGSARDYFLDASNGAYVPSFEVTPIVTLPNDMSYYGGNDKQGNDSAPDQMVRDACAAADASVNFANYDENGDNVIDAVFVIFAGNNEAEGGPEDSVWPHRWGVYEGNVSGSITFDGIVVRDYACTSELRGADSKNPTLSGIGTFCHEFSHSLGLPDLYDTDYEKNGQTTGFYHVSIMGSGNYNGNGDIPPTYNGWERDLLGWTTLKDLSAQEVGATITLGPILSSNESYKIPTFTSPDKEYFVLDAYGNSKWDGPLGGTGLIIYQVDEKDYPGSSLGNFSDVMASNLLNTVGDHPRIRIIEAYGGPVSSATSAANLFAAISYPGSYKRTTFTEGDYGFKGWDGLPPTVGVSDIANNNGTVSFTVVGESGDGSLSVTAYPTSAKVIYTKGKNGWTLRYKAASSSTWTEKAGQTETEVTITGLTPDVSYTVEAVPDGGGTTLSKDFTTPAYLGDYEMPVMKGMKRIYSTGEAIPLNIQGLQKNAVSIVWTIGSAQFENGVVIQSPEPMSGTLECRIVYEDLSVEVVSREIKIQ